jgi:hypothetical protein
MKQMVSRLSDGERRQFLALLERCILALEAD